ncbi:MAG: hypothetical protein EOM06_02360 [Sphingobacteriia bacterium]|nr:hypothetical protein [Sphingobacteriia bacterium]
MPFSACPFFLFLPCMQSIPFYKSFLPNQGMQLFVHLQLNGLKANALIDTGASRSLLDSNRASYYDVPVEGLNQARLLTGVGGERMLVPLAVVQQVSLGELSFEEVAMALIDLSALNRLYASFDLPRLDMVLGSDLLFRMHAQLDYGAGILTISKSI